MANTQEIALGSFRPDLVMANAQCQLAGWSRAMTQVAQGMMAAGLAQADMTRSLYSAAPAEWLAVLQPADQREKSQQWLERTQARYVDLVQHYRRTSDALAETLFEAAGTVVTAMNPAAEDSAASAEAPSRARSVRSEPAAQSTSRQAA